MAVKFKLLNIGLRSATLGTRFIFIFILAKYLEPALMGYYGLFTATVGYALYFVGLDFYTYVTREIIKSPDAERGRMLKGQAALSGALYIFLLPAAIAFLIQANWPTYLMWWFFPILILEHFNQEMSRLLTGLSEQITASVVLFARQGSWAVVAVAMMFWDEQSRNLETVMALWVVAGVVAAAIAIWKLKQLHMGGWRRPIDWAWVKQGIAISTAFLLATLALRGVQTFDRYWLEAVGGIDLVGAYVLFLGVASTLLTFLDAGVFAYAYPALIQLHHNNQHSAVRAKVRQVTLQTLVFSVVFGFISWVLLPYLLLWINKPVYLNAAGLYPWLLLAMVLNALGMAPHYALYAQGQDKDIIYSHMASLFVFVVSAWLLSPIFQSLAIPFALNISFAVILIWKTFAYWQLCKAQITCKSELQPS